MDSMKASLSYPGASPRRSLSSWIGWCPIDEVACWRSQWQGHGYYCRPWPRQLKSQYHCHSLCRKAA
jgi:hypothetical protein